MAKGRPSPTDATSISTQVPPPPNDLGELIIRENIAGGGVFHRVHSEQFGAAQFNPGPRGNARFSPIKDANGRQIPTIYAGATFDCALMETVFHDVPFQAGMKTFDKNKLHDQRHSSIALSDEIVVAALFSTTLRSLGVPRNRLIDTEKDTYPDTRKWAEAIHATCPDVHGLAWTSRQDDRAMALVLFGDRVRVGAVRAIGSSREIATGDAYTEVLALADKIGVNVIDGAL